MLKLFVATSQSVLNMYRTCKKIEDKSICFSHTIISIYNKQRSRWEYFESMAIVAYGKKIPFGSMKILKHPHQI